jgi:hypothetical protein
MGVTTDVMMRPQARPTADNGDQGRPTAEPEQPSGPLGRTVATLGDAAQPGLWLKTPLVQVQGPGRIVDPATGQSVSVILIPIAGPVTAGSRLSLQAMQGLGLRLTDIVEVGVFSGS